MSASNSQLRVFDNTEELSENIIGFDAMTVFEKACAIMKHDPLTPYGHRDIVEALFPSFKGKDAYAGGNRHPDTFPTLTAIVTSPKLVDPETTSLLLGPRVKLEHLQKLYISHCHENACAEWCTKWCGSCDTCQCKCTGSWCARVENCQCECCN